MKATFGGGCFWCTEAVFEHVEGVSSVQSGYMGGKRENPTYEQVCTGSTGHAEVIEIKYDPEKVSYIDLLSVFFQTHDPTTLNRQGNDIGTQYRSVVFYHGSEQKSAVLDMIGELEKSNVYKNPIVTQVEPVQKFWAAENYHDSYFRQNPQNPYCQAVIAPKVQAFLKEYKNKIK
ncbi:MAG TPA: peptide-methionine (S)-S-oxide reductase MsrA [Sphingobacterium sp.]|nr:peptide-methionine (S)-S-oxide reductase MsrA [Sphingobacterium sp.]